MIIDRPNYIAKLKSLQDKDLIKVVTGARRSGKSTLFELFIKELKKQGVADSQILHINLEDYAFDDLRNYRDLYEHVEGRLHPQRQNYVFLDEVQNVEEFQRALDSLYIKKNVDLYVTGSNARLLSGELATLLSGRYIEINMMPFSFREYMSALSNEQPGEIYKKYITEGSFPYLLALETATDRMDYLSSIYDTIIIKDIATRKNIGDVTLVRDVMKFMTNNIGNLTSLTKIANTLTASGRKISVPTVDSYVEALTESYILYRADRFNIQGRQILTSGAKYYVVDLGLYTLLLGDRPADYGHILENIVFLELKRRGYQVFVGKQDSGEVDFVAQKSGETEYYQVCYTAVEPETLERELRPLEAIDDNYKKVLLTMDAVPVDNVRGIERKNVLEWLEET